MLDKKRNTLKTTRNLFNHHPEKEITLELKNSLLNPATVTSPHTRRNNTECLSPEEVEVEVMKRKLSRRSTVKTERKSYNTTPQNWWCVELAVAGNLILTVFQSMRPFAKKFSRRKENSLILKISVLLPMSRSNSWRRVLWWKKRLSKRKLKRKFPSGKLNLFSWELDSNKPEEMGQQKRNSKCLTWLRRATIPSVISVVVASTKKQPRDTFLSARLRLRKIRWDVDDAEW